MRIRNAAIALLASAALVGGGAVPALAAGVQSPTAVMPATSGEPNPADGSSASMDDKITLGSQIRIKGTGLLSTDKKSGSVVAVKIGVRRGDGSFYPVTPVTPPPGSTFGTVDNIWVFDRADDQGNLDLTFDMPDAKNSKTSKGDPHPLAIGTKYTFTLLTGSGKPAGQDPVRSIALESTVVKPNIPDTATVTGPDTAVVGKQYEVAGEGWISEDYTTGSVVAAKWDDGAASLKNENLDNPAGGKVPAGRGIWAVGQANKNGELTLKLDLPDGKNSDTEFKVGEKHKLTLLSGSLLKDPKDKVQSKDLEVEIVARDASVCEADEVRVQHKAGGQTATACIQKAVSAKAGSRISVRGTGWKTKDNKAGAQNIVLKLASRVGNTGDDFQFVQTGKNVLKHPGNGKEDPTMWALISGDQIDAKGSFDTTIPVPATANVPSQLDQKQGTLKAGSKLLVHFQTGLTATDTQHSISSNSLTVDGKAYAGDVDKGTVKYTADPNSAKAWIEYPNGQSTNKTTGPIFGFGEELTLTGSGWCASKPELGGSVLGVKIDEGTISHQPGEGPQANLTTWDLVKVNSADGSFSQKIKLPNGKAAGKGSSTPALKNGVHSLRLLTGSTKAGDVTRTQKISPFTVGAYRPNGRTDLLEAKTQLTPKNKGGLKASINKTKKTITVSSSKLKHQDWVFLSAYTKDGSVRYLFNDTWFRASAKGSVTGKYDSRYLPEGTFKIVAQRPDNSVIGWADLTGSKVKPGATTVKKKSKPKKTTQRTASPETKVIRHTTTVRYVYTYGPRSVQAPVAAPAALAPAAMVNTAAPTGDILAPVASESDLTDANSGALQGTQEGSVVTLTMPLSVPAGSWVAAIIYPGPISPGWTQVDKAGKIRLDVSKLQVGTYKIAIADRDGYLIGWANLLVPDDGEGQVIPPAAGNGGAAPQAAAVRLQEPSGLSLNTWLLIGAGSVLVLGAAGLGLLASRKPKGA
ncbi:MAG: hypothetical protein ACTH9H_07775 [Galactobacter sp.]